VPEAAVGLLQLDEAGRLTDDAALRRWFTMEVLPLEPMLTQFIRKRWRSPCDVADIRQDVYERLLIGAKRGLPKNTAAYMFEITRNAMINRVRRTNVICMHLADQSEDGTPDANWLTPERYLDGQREFSRMLEGLERLPPRCRQVIRLRKVEGLSTKEVARELGIGIDAVEQQTTLGMRALVDFMMGGEGKVKRQSRRIPVDRRA
jgi:RNA polymerase sigma factor (sigma-70 family)